MEASESRLVLVVRNSTANAARALSGSLVSAVLPLILAVILARAEFAVWAVVFGIASYVLYLDFGIPTSLQALVARHDKAGDAPAAIRVVKSGIAIVMLVAALVCAVGVLVGVLYGQIFPDTPPELVGTASLTLLVILVGQIANLISAVVSGYYAGLQRSAEPTRILVPARVVAIVAAVAIALAHGDLPIVAVGYSVPLVAAAVVIFAQFTREAKATPPGPVNAHHTSPTSLIRFSGTLVLWNICLLLISGTGLVVVGRVDYEFVGAYSIATIFAVGISTLDGALIASLIPELGRADVDNDRERLAAVVVRASRLNSRFAFLLAAGVAALAPLIVVILVHPDQRPLAATLIACLALTAAVRLVGAPAALAFIATNTHRKVLWPPVVETVTSVGLAILFGIHWGAIGVALAGLAGASGGLVLALVVSPRLTGAFDPAAARLVLNALLLPALPFLPFAGIAIVVSVTASWTSVFGIVAVVIGFIVSLALLWVLAGSADRASVAKLMHRARPVNSTRE
ncbi:MAG: hypothetical protein ABJB03_01220 [Rhodoglobus sp.]